MKEVIRICTQGRRIHRQNEKATLTIIRNTKGGNTSTGKKGTVIKIQIEF